MLRLEFSNGEAAVASPRPSVLKQRSEPRQEVDDLPATLFLGRASYGALVGNISDSGALVRASAKPLTGDPVIIAVRGYAPLRATVRWSKEGRIGLQFGPVLTLA